jgi:hypothetical protein
VKAPLAAVIVSAVLLLGGAVWAQPQAPNPTPATPPVAAPLTALVDQLVDLFPTVQGEVIEVREGTLTLDAGRRNGARAGLQVELFREGREIKHPKTGAVLGRAERALGQVRISEAQEAFSLAMVAPDRDVKPGDRFRVSAGKVNLVLLPLLGGVREALVEAALQDLVERLGATGRFRVTMGDSANVFLAQEGIKAEDFLKGKAVPQVAQRFQADNLLAVYFKRVQSKPYMEVRFFSGSQPDPAINTAFFVPSSIKPATPAGRFSAGGGPANPPQARARSLLARLLGGDLEAGSYSSAEQSFPLRLAARFNFPVLALDIAVAPRDKIRASPSATGLRSTCTGSSTRSSSPSGPSRSGAWGRSSPSSSPIWTATDSSKSSAAGTRPEPGSAPSS